MKRTITICALAMISILLSGCTQNSMPQTEQPSVPNGTITPEASVTTEATTTTETVAPSAAPTASARPSISEADAKQIVLTQIPGATTENIRRFATDYDNGRLVYEGKIYFEQNEYDFEIDAQDGTILEWDVEPIYDGIM